MRAAAACPGSAAGARASCSRSWCWTPTASCRRSASSIACWPGRCRTGRPRPSTRTSRGCAERSATRRTARRSSARSPATPARRRPAARRPALRDVLVEAEPPPPATPPGPALVGQALALWRGPAFADVADEDWARTDAARLEERRLVASSGASSSTWRSAATGGGRRARGLVGPAPAARAAAGTSDRRPVPVGRQGEALAAYRGARRTLVDELGIEPGRDLQALERARARPGRGLDVHASRRPAAGSTARHDPGRAPPGAASSSAPLPTGTRRRRSRRCWLVALQEVRRYEGTVNQLARGWLHGDLRRAERPTRSTRAVRCSPRSRSASARASTCAWASTAAWPWSAPSATTSARLHRVRRHHAARGPAAGGGRPGEVLVSQATAARSFGLLRLRGRRRQRALWPLRLTGPGPRTSQGSTTARRLTPFVGRDRELGLLQDSLDRGGRRRSDQVVGVAASPGSASRGWCSSSAAVPGEGATVLEGRCLSYGAQMPYRPCWTSSARPAASPPDDATGATLPSVGLTLAALGRDPDDARYLLHALGAPADDGLRALDARWSGPNVRRPARLLLAAARQPVRSCWLSRICTGSTTPRSPSSSSLVDDLGTVAILLLRPTGRRATPPGCRGRSARTSSRCRPLSAESERQVVRFASRDADGAVEPIVERGEGNPFFLEELASAEREALCAAVSRDRAGRPGRPHRPARRDPEGRHPDGGRARSGVLARARRGRLGRARAAAAVARPPEAQEFLREPAPLEGRDFVFKHALDPGRGLREPPGSHVGRRCTARPARRSSGCTPAGSTMAAS